MWTLSVGVAIAMEFCMNLLSICFRMLYCRYAFVCSYTHHSKHVQQPIAIKELDGSHQIDHKVLVIEAVIS